MFLAVRTRLRALRTARLAFLILLAEPCLRARLRARLALRSRRLALEIRAEHNRPALFRSFDDLIDALV